MKKLVMGNAHTYMHNLFFAVVRTGDERANVDN